MPRLVPPLFHIVPPVRSHQTPLWLQNDHFGHLGPFLCPFGAPIEPPDQRNSSIALTRMCPDLFHLYSTLFCQFGTTRPAYGSKKDHFGPFGAFLGFFKGPPTARLTREMVPVHHPGCALTCSTLVSCCSTSSGTPDLLMAPNGDFG